MHTRLASLQYEHAKEHSYILIVRDRDSDKHTDVHLQPGQCSFITHNEALHPSNNALNIYIKTYIQTYKNQDTASYEGKRDIAIYEAHA